MLIKPPLEYGSRFGKINMPAALLSTLMLMPLCAQSMSMCPPQPCNGTVDSCAAAADWIAEGKVLDLFDGSLFICDYDDRKNCLSYRDERKIVLSDVTLLKGKVTSAVSGTLVVTEDLSLACSLEYAPLREVQIGKRVRLYGVNALQQKSSTGASFNLSPENFFFWVPVIN